MALYRKYRPATFAEVVGQEHVTDPLSIALDTGRISHAYLFSGPRGCGKTSSARILARSLNCVEGPTSTPCGVCHSCVALGPGGSGNLDVIELDAASHGGVDDTRELRDRAFYAPAESRYRVFIVDEAHMVTTAGFNALLKIVEEPPAHLIFVFATTEPEKVLPTIRSRTHHYPFRLLPPATMRGLLGKICDQENVQVEESVYPLVIRAGGGSPRDSLSVLDQLLAGAGPEGVTYPRAVSLLGVTDVALIDDAVEALAISDGAALFGTIDHVVEAGHDPRRFATDLLERLRDLILMRAVPDAVERNLVTGPGDVLDRMHDQAQRIGPATLTRYAELLHEGLGDMRGATAPRLLLEVVAARMLLPAATDTEVATLQRLETLERRMAGGALPAAAPAGSAPPAPRPAAAAQASPAPAAPPTSGEPRRRGAEALAALRGNRGETPTAPTPPQQTTAPRQAPQAAPPAAVPRQAPQAAPPAAVPRQAAQPVPSQPTVDSPAAPPMQSQQAVRPATVAGQPSAQPVAAQPEAPQAVRPTTPAQVEAARPPAPALKSDVVSGASAAAGAAAAVSQGDSPETAPQVAVRPPEMSAARVPVGESAPASSTTAPAETPAQQPVSAPPAEVVAQAAMAEGAAQEPTSAAVQTATSPEVSAAAPSTRTADSSNAAQAAGSAAQAAVTTPPTAAVAQAVVAEGSAQLSATPSVKTPAAQEVSSAQSVGAVDSAGAPHAAASDRAAEAPAQQPVSAPPATVVAQAAVAESVDLDPNQTSLLPELDGVVGESGSETAASVDATAAEVSAPAFAFSAQSDEPADAPQEELDVPLFDTPESSAVQIVAGSTAVSAAAEAIGAQPVAAASAIAAGADSGAEVPDAAPALDSEAVSGAETGAATAGSESVAGARADAADAVQVADVAAVPAPSAEVAVAPSAAAQSAVSAGLDGDELLREIEGAWADIRAKVREFGATVQAMLSGASVSRIDGQLIVFAHPNEMLAQRLAQPQNVQAVRSAVQAVLGRDHDVKWEVGGAGAPPAARGAGKGPAAGGEAAPKKAAAKFSRPSQSKSATASAGAATAVTDGTDWGNGPTGGGAVATAAVSAPQVAEVVAPAEPRVFERPAAPRNTPPEDDIPLPDGPDLPDDPGPSDYSPVGYDSVPPAITPEDEREMMAEAAVPVPPEERRDPDDVALELLRAELGATPLEG